jgi:hypothetical protein
MIDDIQRFDFFGRELEEYIKSLSAITIDINPIMEEDVNPTPNPSER